jgi:putative DNA primase/helicase
MTRHLTIERARGRWREILPLLGIETRFLSNRQGPCPFCGGKTRFRFDDLEGNGTWICNHCGAGAGLHLIRKLRGWDYATACRELDKIIGTGPPRFKPTPAPPDDCERRFRNIQEVIDGAVDPDVVSAYLRRRGLSITSPVLLGHPACPYWDDGQLVGRFPAVIAPVLSSSGVLHSVQRIYDDADLEPRKKTMRPIQTVTGCAVRLFEPADELGIAEGCETALAAHEMFGTPTWSLLCAKGIESFAPPTRIRRLIIFGDNDRSFVGQTSAYKLAERLSKTVSVDIRIPPLPGTDWLDVLIEGPP